MNEPAPDSSTVRTWRIIGALPLLLSPFVLFGALFALLAEGITELQQLHILAVIGYPVAYLVGWINASGSLHSGNVAVANKQARFPLIYLAVTLALWPLIGFR